ncbi:MAG: redoxin family protein [Phycisphaerales bacterium]|nr:redoxin family protein [Phycisphaerales bacterium]
MVRDRGLDADCQTNIPSNPGAASIDTDRPDEAGHSRTGWRRTWRVGRVLLVVVAVAVVGANLVRKQSIQQVGGAFAELWSPERAAAEGVGKVIGFSFTDRSGATHSLKEIAGEDATVVAITSPSCPLNRKWAPTLGRLVKFYEGKGVRFVVVNVDGDSSDATLDEMLTAAGLTGPSVTVVRSGGMEIARSMGAYATTSRFVLDGSRRLVYRGATDDQFGVNAARAAPTANWLRQAIDAALTDGFPAVLGTKPPGCKIEYAPVPMKRSGHLADRGAPMAMSSRGR